MKKICFRLVVLVLLYLVEQGLIYGQIKDLRFEQALVGLRKAGRGNIDAGKAKRLESSVLVFSEDKKKIENSQVPKMLSSGNFIPEPYVNDKNEVKVIVLRKATEEEKKQLQEVMGHVKLKPDLVGKLAPPFSVTDVNGINYTLEELKGRIIVMNFWFEACPPCIAEIPELNKLVDKYDGTNVIFLGFSMDDKKQVEAFMEKKEFKYLLIPASRDVVIDYKVRVFPTHILIDENLIVKHIMIGGNPDEMVDFDDNIQQLLVK